ncbi:MAG: DUF2341 domain-containing protein, partial [Candidatus Aenigmatarchaeota archaeon]
MKKESVCLIFPFLTVFIFSFSLSFSQTWLSNWQYRIPITITERSGNTLTDYQVLVSINTQNLISQNKMRNDCGDIRFTDSDGITLLNYWIESGCNSANTKIWVKVPNIPANSNKTIYLYYGNPSATSMSNGDLVFEFFDDFDGPNTTKWVYTTGYSYGFADDGSGYGYGIWFVGDANGKVSTRTTRTFQNNIIIESRLYKNDICADHFIYISQSTSATWAWSSTSGVIRFVWNCDNKYIYRQSSSTYTSRPDEDFYDIQIIITPTNVIFRDWKTRNPSNNNTLQLSDTMDNFYIYIGADQDNTAYKSYFYWLGVRKYSQIEPTISLGNEETQRNLNPIWIIYTSNISYAIINQPILFSSLWNASQIQSNLFLSHYVFSYKLGNSQWINETYKFGTASQTWLSNWQYRIPITITERSGNTLTDYQ